MKSMNKWTTVTSEIKYLNKGVYAGLKFGTNILKNIFVSCLKITFKQLKLITLNNFM